MTTIKKIAMISFLACTSVIVAMENDEESQGSGVFEVVVQQQPSAAETEGQTLQSAREQAVSAQKQCDEQEARFEEQERKQDARRVNLMIISLILGKILVDHYILHR